MKKPILFVFTLVVLALATIKPANATVVLTDIADEYRPIKSISYYKDESKSKTIEQIVKLQQQSTFKGNTDKYISLPRSTAAYWFHMRVKNNSEMNKQWYVNIQYPYYSTIDFYVYKNGQQIKKRKTGNFELIKDREIDHQFFCFNLNFELGKSYDVFFRITKVGRLILPISILSPKGFTRLNRSIHTVFSLYYGFLIIIILFHLLLFVSLKEKNYFYYSIYIVATLFSTLPFSGLGYLYLWTNSSRIHELSPFLFSPPNLICLLLFTRHFLQLKKYAPKIDKFMLSIVVFLSIEFLSLFVFGLAGGLTALMNLVNSVVLVLIYSAAIIVYRRGFKPARFYLIGWSVYSVGLISFNLFFFNVLPYNAITKYSLFFGSTFQIIAFALAIADDMSRERDAKIVAQKDAIEKLQENDRLKTEFVNTLEKNVHERTVELSNAFLKLEAANKNLVIMNDQLQSTHMMIDRDLKMAENVQNKMLPEYPPRSEEWEMSFVSRPMAQVSGDFYDFYEADNKLHGVGVFDVAGHGVSSALLTLLAKSIITRNFFSNLDQTMGKLFTDVNNDLMEEIADIDYYITGVVLRFHGNTVRYANAAHPAVMIKRPDEVVELLKDSKTDEFLSGTFLGAFHDISFDEYSFTINKGEYILLYTDCLVETLNEADEEFGFEGVKQALRDAPAASATEVLKYVVDEFDNFRMDKLNFKPDDDLTVMVLKKL